MIYRVYILDGNPANNLDVGAITKENSAILFPHEIKGIDLKVYQEEGRYTGNTMNDLEVVIEGKILASIDLSQNLLVELIKMMDLSYFISKVEDKFMNKDSDSKEIPSNILEYVKSVDHDLQVEKPDGPEIYNKNIENITKLKEWTLSYDDDGDYRDLLIEFVNDFDDNEGQTSLYHLPKMYATSYEEGYNVKNGSGFFKIKLKQIRTEGVVNHFLKL